jgi:hypothetical protein
MTAMPPESFNSQTEPLRCTTQNLIASPNGRYLLRQYNCQDTLWAQLFYLTLPEKPPTMLPPGYFLDWAPSGKLFLYRQTEDDNILLVEAANPFQFILLNLPSGAYAAIFVADGQQIIYAASAGLKLGSELGLINLSDGSFSYRRTFPEQIIASPRLSPDSAHLAYILMPDSNIPFTIGELWVADFATGAPIQFLAAADAGHGFPPAWAPDGQSLIYVHRDNPDDVLADQRPDALHSNLYQVDIATGNTMPLTTFAGSRVHKALWSPDGQTMVFTANDAVWQLTPGQAPVQVSQSGAARHPTWLVEPTTTP